MRNTNIQSIAARVLSTLVVLFFLFLIVVITTGCEFLSPALPTDWVGYHDPQASQSDSCEEYTLVEITDPAYINGYMEITEDLASSRILYVGPYIYTINPDNSDYLDDALDSLLTLWKPGIEWNVYTKDFDNRVFTIMGDGSNDHNQMLLKVYIRYNGLKHYTGWISQGYIFAGTFNAADYHKIVTKYPSVTRFNFRNTDWDSIEYERCDTAILHSSIYMDSCELKAGREWADFRWGIHSDSIVQLFNDRGWNTVLHAYYDVGGTIDARRGNLTEDEILGFLQHGYQVIVKDNLLE
jgi:hypothetical protein